MGFTIDNIYPWGRSFDEYARMFRLTEVDLQRRILGCGDGPAAFNAELTGRGGSVLSCDPLYRFGGDDIGRRIEQTRPLMLEAMQRNRGAFVWTVFQSPQQVCQVRMAAMERFLEDYESGRQSGRYVDAALPSLPFADASFELALCSHLLFLYSEQLDAAFHVASVGEMCRVADEVRIFPLVDLNGSPSPHVESVMDSASRNGLSVDLDQVNYEFQRGGNRMMRIRHADHRK